MQNLFKSETDTSLPEKVWVNTACLCNSYSFSHIYDFGCVGPRARLPALLQPQLLFTFPPLLCVCVRPCVSG